MDLLKCRTKENSGPGEKPKVYFVCHPDDFRKTFDKISEDIFNTCDCYIYYTEDGSKEALEGGEDGSLKDMDLFIVPVTSRLLSEGDRAVDAVLSHAHKERMPVLPILVEKGISETYERDEKFRKLPYIDSYPRNGLGLSYEEKLDRYLKIFLLTLIYVDIIYGKDGRGEPAERITKAAETETEYGTEVIRCCAWMYYHGIGVVQDNRKASEWCERLLDRITEEHGEEHASALREMKRLIILYEDMGERDKAVKLGEKMYGIQCRILGEDNASVQAPTKYLAYLYAKSGDYEKAVRLEEKIYGTECRILGEEDPQTLTTLHALACDYVGLGSYERALELAGKAYEARNRVLGEEHVSTLRTLVVMADAYDRLGNHEKALELCGRVEAAGIDLPTLTREKIREIYGRNGGLL